MTRCNECCNRNWLLVLFLKKKMSNKICYGIYLLWICMFSINEIWIVGVAILFAMMFIDTITGIAKGYVLWNYSSKKLKRGIFSKLLELLILFWILLLSDLWTSILWEWHIIIWITFNGIIGLLAWAELISAITNYLSVRTWEEYAEQDYVTKILSYVLGLMKQKLDTIDKE